MPGRRAETLKSRFSNAETPGIFGQSPARLPEVSATLGGYKPPLGSVMAHPFPSKVSVASLLLPSVTPPPPELT